ncbi:MAG: NAD+ synthase [Thermodesulfobacteriota bacterium]
MRTVRVAMAQINPTVGALPANAEKILDYVERARCEGADLVVFPELALTGYPPEDLLLKPRFIGDNLELLERLGRKVRGITAVVGFVDGGGGIYNAAALIHAGRVVDVYHKMFLPNYGVFDEKRYFREGAEAVNFVLGGVTFGLGVCEDIWSPEGPIRAQAMAGAEVIVNINASPYYAGKVFLREEMLAERAREGGVAIVYNNMVGGQDELVFDGQGMVVAASGEVMARARAFAEDLLVVDLDLGDEQRPRAPVERVREVTLRAGRRAGGKKGAAPSAARPRREGPGDDLDEVLGALKLGTRDYVTKNGFRHVVVALSGGLDSSLVAALAADALGPDRLTCVYMPSRYSSPESREDAEALARSLGVQLLSISIEDVFRSYLDTLREVFEGRSPDTTEENLQARVRGNIIMALSNKFGWLVLTTGNKSEMSVGYATLYGDMAGGFAVIKDVPKTLAYRLAERINEEAGRALIPERVLTKAPSAELRPGQTDQDTLPPYDVLDGILKAYVEELKSPEDVVSLGFDAATVDRVVRMVDTSEYKRRQAPPGVKITPRAFGKDRRMPITNGRYAGPRGE